MSNWEEIKAGLIRGFTLGATLGFGSIKKSKDIKTIPLKDPNKKKD